MGSVDCNLTQYLAGLFHTTSRFRALADEPGLIIRTANMGNVSVLWPHISKSLKPPRALGPIDSAGVGLTDDEAMLRSRAEGLERYCSSVFSSDQLIRATAEELGSEALDLDTIARCSPTELADPRCPLLQPDKKLPIRWVRGLSLLTGHQVYLPAVMVYLYTGVEGPGERIWFIISTGCAAHTSLERALVSAALEVIERDAISIVWLQKLALPRIEIDCLPPVLTEYWKRYQQASKELEYFFFDATTDVDIPTVYGMQVSRANRRLTTLVSCAAALEPAAAVAGVMREMAAARVAFRQNRPVPEKVEDFTDIFHGASYMARAECLSAFDFLLSSSRRRLLSEMPNLEGANDKQSLTTVVDHLRRRNLDAFAVDLTTDEATRANMRVVRVIIPGLQPISFHYRGRYLGHPRLYAAPRHMGYPVRQEHQINPWPQPFA